MTTIPGELTINLLFSATYQPMHDASRHPPKEVRVAHNYARRLLSDLYGFEEFQALVDQVPVRVFWQRNPGIALALLGGVALMSPYLFGRSNFKRTTA